MAENTKLTKILITTSTLPVTPDDPVPAFVRDQVLALKKQHPELDIHVLAPHNAYSNTKDKTPYEHYTEYRFHYFWPFRLELLAGRGIAPTLKAKPWLYFVVPFLFLFEMIATYRFAKRIKPDMLYVHWFTPQAITAAPVARKLQIPLVFTTHASDVTVLKKIPGARALVEKVCRTAVRYTAVSEQTAQRLRYFWQEDFTPILEKKLSIIPMGTDVTELPKSTAEVTEYQGKRVILFVGRLVERKGVFDLIKAYKQVRNTSPDTVLVIAGDGQDKERLALAATSEGLADVVLFPGYVTGQTKADLLARADILCLPSIIQGAHAEGLPVVFMEGLAAGKIIVASNVSGAQEYLVNATSGFVYPERDVDALASSLISALSMHAQEQKSMQAAARELADNFSWPKVAEAHYTVLKDAFDSFHAKKL